MHAHAAPSSLDLAEDRWVGICFYVGGGNCLS